MAKIIEYGTKDNLHAEKHYDIDTDTVNAKMVPIKERYLIVTFPWRKTTYCINRDEPVRGWVKFGLWWYRHRLGRCWYLRTGWVN
jgi:hypothetical protein